LDNSDYYQPTKEVKEDPVGLLQAVSTAAAALAEGKLPTKSRGGADPVRKGQAGENAVRNAVDIGPKSQFSINGRHRIADGLNLTSGTITEVKNVQYQGLTTQIQDYIDYAGQQG
jgi:hypothetical protein